MLSSIKLTLRESVRTKERNKISTNDDDDVGLELIALGK
jgi:hypothetical protein